MTNWDWMREKLQELAGEEKATPAVLKTLDEVLSEFAGYSCIDCEYFVEDEYGCTEEKSCSEAQCEYLNREIEEG